MIPSSIYIHSATLVRADKTTKTATKKSIFSDGFVCFVPCGKRSHFVCYEDDDDDIWLCLCFNYNLQVAIFFFFQDSIYRASHPSATTHTHTHTSQRPKTDGRQGKLSCIVRRYAERKSIFPLNEKNCSHRNARTCSAVPTMRATSTEKQITQLHVPFTRCLIKRKRVFFRFLFCFNAPQHSVAAANSARINPACR